MPYNSDLDELKRLAAEAELNPQYRLFAEFAALRAQGVRQGALNRLARFLELAPLWSFPERLGFVRWLLGRSRQFSDSTVVLPQPIREVLVVPTVREWATASPELADPFLWLGLLRCDDPALHLERALQLDPSCDLARKTLVEWIPADIEYNQHELPQLYIHDPRDDLKGLERATILLDERLTDEWTAVVRQEISELQRHAAKWLADHPRADDFAVH